MLQVNNFDDKRDKFYVSDRTSRQEGRYKAFTDGKIFLLIK